MQRMIDQLNRESEAGDHSPNTQQEHLAISRSRAQQMVDLIKDEEMQKALVKVTARGNQILEENPEMKSPLGVLAGAAALWYGKTIGILKGDTYKAWTRVEARGRSGEVWLQSPILDGKMRFSGDDGMSISMNRSISSINSQAELNYNVQSQSFSTQLHHQLAPNLDFSFGASKAPSAIQTDGRATLQYHLDF
jgi:hypothetical protein